tara:strand:+ start:403 stop:846 length:444 start_codon:yes stop_codon:yes gene_type:complete
MQSQKLKKVVSIFIYAKNQLLLQLRDEKKEISHPGCWGLISGALNSNENPYRGIKREIKEEISISNIKNLVFVGIFLSRKNESIIHYVFKSNLNSLQGIKLKEGIEYSFFSKTDFFRGHKFSKNLKKTCYIVNNPIMREFYYKTQGS